MVYEQVSSSIQISSADIVSRPSCLMKHAARIEVGFKTGRASGLLALTALSSDLEDVVLWDFH
jgi:hypothetical protein